MWMDERFRSNNKVSKHKLELFEHAQSMSKWPAGLVYIGSFINYLLYLPDPFPRGLSIDLEGSSIFLPFALLMHIDGLGLFSHLYGALLNCLFMFKGSWIDHTALCREVG